MNIYHYAASPVVEQVSFVKSDGGSLRAYLTSANSATSDQLHSVICDMADAGFQCMPSMKDGKSTLEVRAIGSEQGFLKLLEEKGHITGLAHHTQNDPVEEPKGFLDKIKKRSLFASGSLYVLGDAFFFSYGKKDSSKLDMAAAVAYAMGTMSTLTLARKDQSDLQVKDISREMVKYVKSQQADIDHTDCAIKSVTDDSHTGIVQKTHDTLRHYPSEMFSLFTGIAGVLIAVAAYKTKITQQPTVNAIKEAGVKLRKEGTHLMAEALDKAAEEKAVRALRKEGWGDIGLGVMTAASCAFGALVKEKAHDPDSPKKSGVSAMWEWMQEHPLSVEGAGLMASTMCHAWSTMTAWKEGDSSRKKAITMRAGFIVTNILAEILIMVSSKGHGDGVVSDKSVDESVIALAADMIAKQNPKLQPTLIEHVASFLGQQTVLALKDVDVHAELQQRVEQMRDNPWSKAGAAYAPPMDKQPLITPAKMQGWQDKIMQAAVSMKPLPGIH